MTPAIAPTAPALGYLGQYGNLYTGYAYSKSHRQASLNLSGGVVAHRGGVTLSQPLGSTFALVEAKDAQGVGIENQTGVRIDPSATLSYHKAFPIGSILSRSTLRTSIPFLMSLTR